MTIIQKSFNPLFESINLLRYAVKDADDSVLNNRTLNQNSKKKLEFVKGVRSEILKKLSKAQEELEFYFKTKEKDGESCLFDILFLSEEYLSVDSPSLSEWLEHLDSMKREDFYEELGRKVFCYNQKVNDSTNMTVCRSLEDVLRLILQMNIDDKQKILLQDIVLNRQNHIEKVIPLLQTSLETINAHSTQLKEYAQEFYSYWTKTLGSMSILSYLEKNIAIKMSMEENQKGCILCPAIFRPLSINYAMSMDEKTGLYTREDICTFGFLFGDDIPLSVSIYSKTEMSQEQALKCLKVLSDKSKFDILVLASKQSMYGAQLAQKLNLTTATVSYHTSELVSCGLLELEKKGNRIYYYADSEGINNFISFLSKTLNI